MEKSQKIGHKKQASNIHQWKPWLKAGVKTEEGKKIVSQNAWKHGDRSFQTIQFLKSFHLKGKVARAETDWFLSMSLLMDLVEEADAFKPCESVNQDLIHNHKKIKGENFPLSP